MRRATAREWLAARIVLVGGFAAAIAVAAYFALQPAPPPVTEEANIPPPEAQAPAQTQQQTDANAAMLVCAQELLNAKNNGSIPSYGQLSSLVPTVTNVKGRYACHATTPAASYTINADLVCRNLTDSHCVHIYNVTTGDGKILYQRQG